MAYPGLAHEEHKYLGKEYCTGYTDVYGKWNTGFYCPQYGSKTAVFCCGTAVFKYCCTNQEPVDPNSSSGVLLDGDDPNFDGGSHHGVSSAVFVRVPIVFGVVCGIAAVLVLLIVAACYFCSCCFAYKKRRNDHLGHNELPHHLNHLHLNHAMLPAPPTNMSQTGLYRNSATPSTSSTITASSNLLNLYSGGTANNGPLTSSSLVTTPLDLDWASSIASTYQSQQTLFTPPALQFTPSGPGPGNTLSPAAAATLAVALSQQQSRHHANSAANSLLGSNCGTPSIISGATLGSNVGRLPSVSQAYQNFLNSSSSTLSSNSLPASMPPRGLGPPQPQLHRANLPQQISTTASIVNSYLASLQQQSQHTSSHPETQQPPAVVPPPQLPPVDRTRHPSPPPSYFQTVSSSSYHGGSNNSNNNYINSRNSRSATHNRQNRMSTIQSILGGGSGTGYSSGTNWSNEDDLVLAEFLLRHENTLRRSLGLPNSNNRNGSNVNNNINNAHNNSSSANGFRNRGNPMLTQRELIELLLRLTHHGNTAPIHGSSSATSSVSRSESRAGSESHSTASSVATTRSTASGSSSTSNNGKVNNGNTNSCTKLTISEVEEDDPNSCSQECNMGIGGREGSGVTMRNSKSSRLDLSLSRLSVGENDSGVASSTCSTVGSEVADSVIGSIKMISRDLSVEAMKLKKEPHAVDDDGIQQDVKVVVHQHDNVTAIAKKMKEKLHEQQLAATIHPERNCDGGGVGEEKDDKCTTGGVVLVPTSNEGDGSEGDVRLKGNKNSIGAGSGSDGEIIEILDGRDGNGNSGSLPQATLSTGITSSISPPGGVRVVSCENGISTVATATP